MKGVGADKQYWEALRAGRLEMQQCVSCAKWHWPAVWRCANCGSWQQQWREVPLRGTLFSWTRTHHDFGAPASFRLPLVSVVVELDGADHRRLLGTLFGDESGLRIGARVVGEIGSVDIGGEQLPSLRWRVTEELSDVA